MSRVRVSLAAPSLICNIFFVIVKRKSLAGWQTGYAADCKSVYLGSTPGPASISYVNKCGSRKELVEILISREPISTLKNNYPMPGWWNW
jgi:hypothetical protein